MSLELKRTVKTASKIKGSPLPPFKDIIYSTRCKKKAFSVKITKDPSHPAYKVKVY